MSEKRAPPPPSFPPTVKPKENFCLLHRGELASETYTCPTCKTQYCVECAKKAKSEQKFCVKCKQLILI